MIRKGAGILTQSVFHYSHCILHFTSQSSKMMTWKTVSAVREAGANSYEPQQRRQISPALENQTSPKTSQRREY